ncbi:MAG: FtsX-like permease family protein, partial [Ruminococcus sp.]|nr:FtsX-like permease family protein [Ruminococcus sp.]
AVLYLLLKHVIDKSSFALSLMRIFGYRDREVNRIFVDSNLLIVGVAALLAVIVGKPVIDGFYPTLITDIELGLDFTFKPVIYVIIAAVIILSYFASTYLLKRKLRKADFTEVLKERD